MKQFSIFLLTMALLIANNAPSWSQGATDQNTFLGYQAGYANSTGNANTFVGNQAGYYNTSGVNNVFIGNRAGYGSSGSTAYGNVCLGTYSGNSLSSGIFNMFIGPFSGNNITTGSYNTLIGNATGAYNVTGRFNTAIGDGAGYSFTSDNNLFLGVHAGFNTSTGGNNIVIGTNAGVTNQSGSSNTIIGYLADVGNANLTNAGAIGANAQVTISNALVLGSNANVGIGTTAPANKLEVVSNSTNTSGLRLKNLKSTSPATVLSTNKFLTVDSNGDVILGSTNGSARIGADESLNWIADGDNMRNGNSGGIIIGPGVDKTPAGYRLYVADGILTEKVKVAVKSSIDWSDHVFATGYKLASLAEVEAHIQKSGHLPGIPSAQEMVEKGNDLHQTDAKLLAKIEELTLYSIQLEKADQAKQRQLDQQQIRIDELEKLVKQMLKQK
ncbi:bZIP transcription factor [Spirosoma litoris]